ncbi:hypothetical protein CTheo_7099 [Ceratobasidium theobromae]|uniref:Uncharacterized protein n=1 Tax=Ceratobasidium theobromae TaxID=1582974 RepID=A0A5N5QCX9_9AGAM|nr:hypothetical protein CTheo_7099 [Ceratobasidium theobromae]
MPGPISQEKIQEHTSLINALNALDYVPAAQEDNDARLAVLNAEIGLIQQEVEILGKKTKSEYKDLHRAKSPTRQFFLWLQQGEGAVNQLLTKENKEYLEAFQAEHGAREKQVVLLQEKHERETVKADLTNKQRVLEDAKKKIQALYEGLFTGPTPDYPEEEAAERQFLRAESNYYHAQLYFNKHSTALALLIKARLKIRTCVTQVVEALTATENIKKSGFFSTINERSVQSKSLLGAFTDAANAHILLWDADLSIGSRVYRDMVPSGIIPSGEHSGQCFIRVLNECLRKLQEVHTCLVCETTEGYRRLNEQHETIRQCAVDLRTARKELVDIRCQIMIGLTNPATLEAHTRISAPNAHEIGDSELPVYFDTKNSTGIPTTDPRGKVSIGVPSYEESHTHIKAVEGSGVELPGSSSQGTTSTPPAYIPQASIPTHTPRAVGGFRVSPTSTNGLAHCPSLKLKIPEPQGGGSPSPTTPVAGPSTSGTQPCSNSWSLNPYAAEIVRRASRDNIGLMVPGDHPGNNPFLSPLSEGIDINDIPQPEDASSSG